MLRMARVVTLGEPLGLLALFGLWMIAGGPSSTRPAAKGVMLVSALGFAWAMICLVVLFAERTSEFTSLTELAAYMMGSIIFALWGAAVPVKAPVTRDTVGNGERAVRVGGALAQGVRRWLQ